MLEINWLKKEVLHMKKVANISLQIAENMTLTKKQKEIIHTSSKIYDTGKVCIPLDVYNKPSELTKDEFEMASIHVLEGATEALKKGYTIEIANNILYHHENFNGTGYLKLEGQEIPLGARIIRIADVFDTLTMDRPYRKKYSRKKALEIMESEKSYYDPKIFNIFKTLIKRGTIS